LGRLLQGEIGESQGAISGRECTPPTVHCAAARSRGLPRPWQRAGSRLRQRLPGGRRPHADRASPPRCQASRPHAGERQAIWHLVPAACDLVARRYSPAGFNIGLNDGPAAGQRSRTCRFTSYLGTPAMSRIRGVESGGCCRSAPH